METIFISHKVEHPMTVISSPHLKDEDYVGWGIRRAAQAWCYNVWEYKTLNGKKINSHNCLN